jgi:hypothetical protein
MRNGVYFTDFQVDGVSQRGIVAAEDGTIRGFDKRYFYTVDRSQMNRQDTGLQNDAEML